MVAIAQDTPHPPEAVATMSESHERTKHSPRPLPSPPGADVEPPSRHPLWRDVSTKDWEDWRWQSQNAIRSVRQLRGLIPFTEDELELMGLNRNKVEKRAREGGAGGRFCRAEGVEGGSRPRRTDVATVNQRMTM